MNSLLFLVSVLASFSMLYLCYRLFGKAGLFAWVAFAGVVANIEVLKTVTCFGLETTLGNALFGTVFLATDILSEKFGEKDANKAVHLGFFVSVSFIVLTRLDVVFIPSESDFINDSFVQIFSMTPRVCIGSMLAYFIGNKLDVFLYNRMKNRNKNALIWVRNNVCTLLAQLVDNFIFYFTAFLGIMDFDKLLMICINVWVLEAVVALLDTPFLYLTLKSTCREKIPEKKE